jgi:hypothetical protein
VLLQREQNHRNAETVITHGSMMYARHKKETLMYLEASNKHLQPRFVTAALELFSAFN